MTQIDIAALVGKLSSQIGDDIQVIFNHESLFKQSRAALIAQDSELKRLREVLAEAKETLVEVQCEMWLNASGRWTLNDFINRAIVRRITATISAARAALGEKP